MVSERDASQAPDPHETDELQAEARGEGPYRPESEGEGDGGSLWDTARDAMKLASGMDSKQEGDRKGE
jgi:hypothetical protein